MALFGDLKDNDFANKLADHYHKHIGKNQFKDIRSEAEIHNVQTPLWLKAPLMQRGIQRGKDNPSGKINFITAPIMDTVRVGKFMGSPNGLLFMAKQFGLQLTNPKSEFPPLIPAGLHPNRIFNPLSFIGQIPANAIGLHMDRHGAGFANVPEFNYEYTVKFYNNPPFPQDPNDTFNRLVRLAKELGTGRFDKAAAPLNVPKGIAKINTILDKLAGFANRGKGEPIKMLSGLMGPNSLFGIGRTTIRRSRFPASFTSEKIKMQYSHGDDTYIKKNPEGSYKAIAEHPSALEGIYDVVIDGPDAEGESTTPRGIFAYKSFEYGDIIRASKESTLIDYTGKKDYIETNANSVYGLVDYGNQRGESDKLVTEEDPELNDFVKFSITGKIDNAERILKFRAYGLGSISDDTSFNWNEVNYSGRTATQFAFDKVSRTLTHDLIIPAFTPDELKANYNKLDQLYKMASPSIDSSGLPTAPLNKFTLGDLYDDVNVVIEKITFTIEEDFPWDIGVGAEGETAEAQLPMVIKLNLSYKFATNVDGNLFTNSSRFFGQKIEEFRNV
tara:strand:- start:47010 stop:48680 length:1671 start_codon:yes stop_codon:yes gene_type:complete